ncbi:MAG: ADP-forming succinate--CoA ligase subunit beta [Planctomycetota bacterium]|nr:MAG: ADP-forming succinate--CoA ligase subunit beta [Planctomycetota bacterium]
MNIHEYQAKEIFRRFGIPTLPGRVATTAEEAQAVANDLPASPVTVLKAQIHAGGRGKGRFKEHPDLGGVKVLAERSLVGSTADLMLSSTLVTKQTGPEGKVVHQVYVEAGCAIAKEFYAAVTLDRRAQAPAIMVSPEGGMDIEEVAEKTPELIFTEVVDPRYGLHGFQARRLAKALGLRGKPLKAAADLLVKLVRCFLESDASLVEVNPLVLTEEDEVLALDAKIGLDDNGLPRHPDLAAYRDPNEMTSEEQKAKEHDLSYISLSGNVGCMVNGAGLAMATMDMIKHCGGEPANFLDVGGGATEERITAAFQIIVSDPDVKAILVNVFGGILLCDKLAAGIVSACRSLDLKVPLVVRLEGTNVEEGRRILEESGLEIQFAPSLKEAAERVVAAAGGAA